MSDANETIAAIVAEIRKAAKDSYAEKTAKRLEDHEATGTRDALDIKDAIQCLRDDDKYLLDLANRIERAANNLESSFGMALSIEEGLRKRDRERAGSATAMREALEKVHKAFRDGLIGAHAIATDTEAEALFRLWHTEIPAALAAPARNCDVGTAAEQKARHDRFCSRHYKAECVDSQCFGCPAHDEKTETDCEFVWGQLPFDQAEGGAKCIDGLRGHPDCRGCDEHCLDVRKRNCFYWNPDIGKCALDGKPSCRIACGNFHVSKEEKPGPAEGGDHA